MKRALFHDDASPRLAIGLMSGTSADGIDAALVEISGCSTDTRVRLLSFLTLPFSDAARARILRVAAGDFGGTEELCLLNFIWVSSAPTPARPCAHRRRCPR